jgi:hypothetical protein
MDLLNLIVSDADQCAKYGENIGVLVQNIEKILGREIKSCRIDSHGIGWDLQYPYHELNRDKETTNP